MNTQFNTVSPPAAVPAPETVKDFFDAVIKGDTAAVGDYLDSYPSLLENKGSDTGGTAVIAAANEGDFDMLKFLHGRGADLLATDNGDYGAMFYAGHKGNREIAQYLVGQGIDPRSANKSGMTAVSAARANDFLSFSEELERMMPEHLLKVEAEMRAREAADHALREENARLIAENIRRGAGEIVAPMKAKFRPKI